MWRGGGALWLSRPIDMTRGPQCGLDAARGRFIKWLINVSESLKYFCPLCLWASS